MVAIHICWYFFGTLLVSYQIAPEKWLSTYTAVSIHRQTKYAVITTVLEEAFSKTCNVSFHGATRLRAFHQVFSFLRKMQSTLNGHAWTCSLSGHPRDADIWVIEPGGQGQLRVWLELPNTIQKPFPLCVSQHCRTFGCLTWVPYESVFGAKLFAYKLKQIQGQWDSWQHFKMDSWWKWTLGGH